MRKKKRLIFQLPGMSLYQSDFKDICPSCFSYLARIEMIAKHLSTGKLKVFSSYGYFPEHKRYILKCVFNICKTPEDFCSTLNEVDLSELTVQALPWGATMVSWDEEKLQQQLLKIIQQNHRNTKWLAKLFDDPKTLRKIEINTLSHFIVFDYFGQILSIDQPDKFIIRRLMWVQKVDSEIFPELCAAVLKKFQKPNLHFLAENGLFDILKIALEIFF